MKFHTVHRLPVAFVLGFYLILASGIGVQSSSKREFELQKGATLGKNLGDKWLDSSQPMTAISKGGCSRVHLPYNQIDTASLTGFSEEHLAMMPSAYWKYEEGTVRITFAKTPKPCKGASCDVPDDDSQSDMTAVGGIGIDRTTNQCGLINMPFRINSSLWTGHHSLISFQYHTQIGSSLLRPPNLFNHVA